MREGREAARRRGTILNLPPTLSQAKLCLENLITASSYLHSPGNEKNVYNKKKSEMKTLIAFLKPVFRGKNSENIFTVMTKGTFSFLGNFLIIKEDGKYLV